MVGGGAILDAFLQERLIDEWIITLTPHLLGSGIPLFTSVNITLGTRRRIHMKKRAIRFLSMGIGFSTAVFF